MYFDGRFFTFKSIRLGIFFIFFAGCKLQKNGVSTDSTSKHTQTSTVESAGVAPAVEKNLVNSNTPTSTHNANPTAQPTLSIQKPSSSGHFLFMDKELVCKNASACYPQVESEARRIVGYFTDIHVERFLLPAFDANLDIDHAQTLLMAKVINEKNKYFFTNERFNFEYASGYYATSNPSGPSQSGHFDCNAYKSIREKNLIDLKTRYPNAFLGLHMKDEPSIHEIPRIGEMMDCVRSIPALAGLEIYINLLPFSSNHQALYGINDKRGFNSFPDMGISCPSGEITNVAVYEEHSSGYFNYLKAAAALAPTYLAVDYYPFKIDRLNCFRGTEKILARNLTLLSFASSQHRAEPVFNLQNMATPDETDYTVANGHQMRWIYGLSLSLGIKRFTYFLSHHAVDNSTIMWGILDVWNNTTGIYNVVKDWLVGLSAPYQEILKNSHLEKYSAPHASAWYGVNHWWFQYRNTNLGQYFDPTTGYRYIVASSGHPGSYESEMIAIDGWYQKIEVFYPKENRWIDLGTANHIVPEFSGIGSTVLIYRMK